MVNESQPIQPSIVCSWSPDIPVEILTIGDQNDPNQWDPDGAIIHAIAEDNFVCLKKTEDGSCMIKIKTNDDVLQVTNISIVSEAHIFEIYGKHGEYIKTVRCDFLTNEKDIDMYVGQSSLLTTHEISIKFPGSKKEFWLCGIKLIIRKNSSPPSSIFDYQLIDEKLQSSSQPITEKAEKFKKFLQEYAAKKCSQNNMDIQMFLKLMGEEYMAQLMPGNSINENVLKHSIGSIQSSVKNMNIHEQLHNRIKTEESSSPEQSASSLLKNYVDESIQKLEEKLKLNFKKELATLESKQNEKLDAILDLLRNSALR